MPAQLADILAEIDRLLEPARFKDYGPNGLQVPGPAEVNTLATGVSAHAELFEMAAGERAELLIVHHGLFWGSGPGPIDAALKRRLKILFDADIALAAYHLPLDAHPEVGNNALLARALGARATRAVRPARGPADRLHREPSRQMGSPAAELFTRVRDITSREPLVFDAGPARVRRLAIVSGAGADYLADAVAAGADALLTGEPAERTMAVGARVRACTSSPPVTTRPRRSASDAWASTSPSASRCARCSSTCQTRCNDQRVQAPFCLIRSRRGALMEVTAAASRTGSKTMADLIPGAAAEHAQNTAVRYKRDGAWHDVTYAELADIVQEIGLGLIDLGIQPGERICILANTRPEWSYLDMAATSVGAVVVPIYPTNSPEECLWVISDSGASHDRVRERRTARQDRSHPRPGSRTSARSS